MVGKVDGTSLIEHSDRVSDVSKIILDNLPNIKIMNSDLYKSVILASKLHDIGKCISEFQNYIKGTSKSKKEPKYLHNEIGWAFINSYVEFENKYIKEYVLDMVYWHHGIKNEYRKDNCIDILDTCSPSDINDMKNYVLTLNINATINYIIDNDFDKVPNYYINDSEANMYKTIGRMCLIVADRLVSDNLHITKHEVLKHINGNSKNIQNFDIYRNHSFYMNDRFKKQLDIIDKTNNTTNLIKAPAGYGKTMLGLLWKEKRMDDNIVWVCPRNMVAETVYKSIIDELEEADINDISVELFLTNEVKKSTHNKVPFSSSIVVTNIDSFISPTTSSLNSDRLYRILNGKVVFDEYHELVTDSGLFSCFINIMNIRHKITNAETLLLSATPSLIHTLWETVNHETNVLPNKNTHYPAVHDKKYKVSFTEKTYLNNYLKIFNSISNAQIYKYENKLKHLFHSKYSDIDKENIMDYLYENYGKNSNKSLKENVVGTHILQASLDISFKHICESILSPESTLQRIGRCNRFGEYNDSSICILDIDEKSENAVLENLYNKDLKLKWIEFIKNNIKEGSKVDLDFLYELYNSFNNIYQKDIQKHIRRVLNTSQIHTCEKIYPIKYYNKMKKSDVYKAGGNKVRCTNSEIFITCPIVNTNPTQYSEAFSYPIYDSIGNTFGEIGNHFTTIKSAMKNITNRKDSYDYTKILHKNTNIDTVRKYAKLSIYPYIVFNKFYHKEYGLLNKSTKEKIFG